MESAEKPFRSTSRKVEACADAGGRLSSKTPEKPSLLPYGVLPKKYEVLGQFFDGLDSSVRLLKLNGSVSTFTNICPVIERLTDRRFAHKHLSQLKFILPEAIEIKKVLTFDEQTSCKKSNLSVSLNANAVQKDGKTSLDNGKISLRKLFHARLSEFVNAHPEEDEVPEAPLLEPFNHTQDRISKILRSNASLPAEASRVGLQPAVVSHLSGSFQRHFSQKVENNIPGNTSQVKSEVSLGHASLSVPEPHQDEVSHDEEANSSEQPKDELASQTSSEECLTDSAALVVCPPSNDIATPRKVIDPLRNDDSPLKISSFESTPAKLASTDSAALVVCPPSNDIATPRKVIDPLRNDDSPLKISSFESTPAKLASTDSAALVVCPPSNDIATPRKVIDPLRNDDSPLKISSFESTPAKLASTPARLMAATPALQPPKRNFMSPEDDCASSPPKLVRRPPCTRSLKFDTPVKDTSVEDEVRKKDSVRSDDDIFDILPQDLLQKIRDREKKATEDKDPAISRAKRRREILAALPQLFNMIHFLFKSTKRSVITREELIYQIIKSRFDIIDRREVEEQLDLMKELVPEWIAEKPASTGDHLFSINKMSDPDSIRRRLAEAE